VSTIKRGVIAYIIANICPVVSVCRHCKTALFVGHNGTCPGCTLWPQHDSDAVINRVVLAKLGILAPVAAGQSSDAPSSSVVTESVPKLSAVDRELERLAEEGPDWPRFADATPISSAEAIKQGRLAYRGALTAPLSASLLKLIRSGKFTQLSLALPRDTAAAAAADQATARGQVLRLGGDGAISTHAALSVRPLTDFGELIEAFFCSIAPALFDRPRALLDWVVLMRTAAMLTRLQGSEQALEYVASVLSDAVPQRAEFHEFDRRVLDESRFALAGRRPFLPQAHPPPPMMGGHPHYPGADPLGLRMRGRNFRDGCCREWNLGGCAEPCRAGRQHGRCCLVVCARADAHRAVNCAHYTGEQRRFLEEAVAAGLSGRGGFGRRDGRGGGRGGRGGGRGGGPRQSPQRQQQPAAAKPADRH
jgi:hypothetical protein